jgi:hypothetical protein
MAADIPDAALGVLIEGFDKHGILVVFNAGVKIKPQYRLSIRGFCFCDKAEDGQKNSFGKPSYKKSRLSHLAANGFLN